MFVFLPSQPRWTCTSWRRSQRALKPLMFWWENWTFSRDPLWPSFASPLLCCSLDSLRSPYRPGKNGHCPVQVHIKTVSHFRRNQFHKFNNQLMESEPPVGKRQVPVHSPGPWWKGTAISRNRTLDGNYHDWWSKNAFAQNGSRSGNSSIGTPLSLHLPLARSSMTWLTRQKTGVTCWLE